MALIARRTPVAGAETWPWPDDCHPVLRRIYARRDLSSPEELELSLSALRPVGEFSSVDAAVDLLLRHRESRIVIFGDFDADGATSSALMVLCLRDLGFTDVDFFVPDRFELGYGLTPEAVERIDPEPELIVTVDNGISSIDGVACARDRGIEVLITDHHLAGEQLPRANAIVNPNVAGDAFAGKCLAGVGVAFYVLAALGRAVGKAGAVARYLDLVALGTMADVVHLDQSNRILINEGLRRMRAGQCRPGLRALCEVAGLPLRDLHSTSLAYQIAPRLNAAGRLDDMAVGVRCLLSDSPSEALDLARKLDSLNRERRVIEAQMRAEAVELVESSETLAEEALPTIVCLHRQDWHEGIVGLVASRLKDRYHRPVIAFASTENGALKGSARSVSGFHIRDALAEVDAAHPGLITRFGGHAMAAGLTLAEASLEAFSAAVQGVADRHLSPSLLKGEIVTDGELAAEHLTVEVAELLRNAGPWGQGFPEPSFDGVFELLDRRIVGQAHLKMQVRERASGRTLGAIAFNHGETDCAPGDVLRLVYRLAVDDYGPRPSAQLIVEHVFASSTLEPESHPG
ncbi:MAG: single-stranded-DNA-specific exonuclease RecJ [Gammaproteobacteria bacterium]|nr:single-stranded-DNA-specific exonuclease RecJ [Gammaproteobacteria bacterium]